MEFKNFSFGLSSVSESYLLTSSACGAARLIYLSSCLPVPSLRYSIVCQFVQQKRPHLHSFSRDEPRSTLPAGSGICVNTRKHTSRTHAHKLVGTEWKSRGNLYGVPWGNPLESRDRVPPARRTISNCPPLKVSENRIIRRLQVIDCLIVVLIHP